MRLILALVLGVFVLGSAPVFAQIYSEPGRGTTTRAALMGAIRPHVEWDRGEPIEFVVNDLRAAGGVAFTALAPQRPGGAPIGFTATPWYRRSSQYGSDFMDFMDGTHTEVLYRKLGDTWVAVHFAIGSTDVWIADPEYCIEYAAVIPEWCK